MFLLALVLAQASDLIFVTHVIRHGARTPDSVYSFNEEYWQNTTKYELTAVGQRQQFLLGTEMRRRYIEVNQLLSNSYKSDEVYIRSTDTNRTIASALSFFKGFYPDSTGPSVRPGVNARPPFVVQNIEQIEAELGLSALPNNAQPVPIHVVAQNEDLMLKGYKDFNCPKMTEFEANVESSAFWQNETSFYSDVFKTAGLQLGLNISSFHMAKQVTTSLLCDIFDGYPNPSALTQEILDSLIQASSAYKYSIPFHNQTASYLGSTYFYRELLANMNSALTEKSRLRMAFYSAHDTTLAAFLSALNYTGTKNIPFASILTFELYKNSTISITFNDINLTSAHCNDQCTYEQFKSQLSDVVSIDYKAGCGLVQLTQE